MTDAAPTALTLTEDQVEAALYAISGFVDRRRLENRPVPREVSALHQRLAIASECGSEIPSDGGQLEDDDLIGTGEAATILACSTRWVTTIHTDLGGDKIGGRYLYRRQAVIDYAAAKHQPIEGQKPHDDV